MKSFAVVALLVAFGAAQAQAPAKMPKVVEEMDAKVLADIVKIVRTDFDSDLGRVVWLVEAKGPAPFPLLVVRFFDADDVEFEARFIDWQHGSRTTGERTRAILVMPGGSETLARTKRMLVALPPSAR